MRKTPPRASHPAAALALALATCIHSNDLQPDRGPLSASAAPQHTAVAAAAAAAPAAHAAALPLLAVIIGAAGPRVATYVEAWRRSRGRVLSWHVFAALPPLAQASLAATHKLRPPGCSLAGDGAEGRRCAWAPAWRLKRSMRVLLPLAEVPAHPAAAADSFHLAGPNK